MPHWRAQVGGCAYLGGLAQIAQQDDTHRETHVRLEDTRDE